MTNFVTEEQLYASRFGSDCRFIRIGNAGMKLYRAATIRDEQFELQRKFHKIRLAPACWFIFEFKGPEGNMLYAYYSEVAEVRSSYGCEDHDQWDSLAYEMDRRLSEKGIEWEDIHGGNVGILNGELILIDFGCISGI